MQGHTSIIQEIILKTNNKPQYNSFNCPVILVDSMDNLIQRWPGKLNRAKILFFATTYACQKGIFKFKDIVSDDVEKKMLMIRVTPELVEAMEPILNRHKNLNQTMFYIIALVEFLKKCDELLKQIDNLFIAESKDTDRGIILKESLDKLLAKKNDFVSKISKEIFDAGDKIYCITYKSRVASLLLDMLFEDDHLHPRKIYVL